MQPQYLTEREVSQMTGIKISTLRNHRHRRVGLPYIKYGSMVLYKVEDVREHLDGCRIDFDCGPADYKKRATAEEDLRAARPADDQHPKSSGRGNGSRTPAGKRSPADWIRQAPLGG